MARTRRPSPPHEAPANTMQTDTQTWAYPVAARVMFAILTAFILGIAALLFSLPLIVPTAGSDATTLWITDITGFFMVCLGLFLAFGLIAISRTRISVGAGALVATITDHHNIFLVPHFTSYRIPLTEIRSVERREEVVKSFGLTSIRDSLSIVTASGARIGLVTNARGASVGLQIGPIASGIAAAAGLPVTDGGIVSSKAPGLYGEAASTWSEAKLDPASANRARTAAQRTMQLVLLMAMSVLVLRACLH